MCASVGACRGMCVKVSLIKLHLAGFMRDVSAFTTQRVLIRKRMLNRFDPEQQCLVCFVTHGFSEPLTETGSH